MISLAQPVAEAAAPLPASPQPRLVNAAHDFEAQMINELLKPLTAGASLGDDESDSGSGSGGALGQFAAESLGRALSDRGGFGIATSIVRELSQFGPSPQNENGAGDSHQLSDHQHGQMTRVISKTADIPAKE